MYPHPLTSPPSTYRLKVGKAGKEHNKEQDTQPILYATLVVVDLVIHHTQQNANKGCEHKGKEQGEDVSCILWGGG